MERPTLSCTLPGLALLLACPARAQDNATLQKKLANPVSDLATLPLDYTGKARAAPGAGFQHTLGLAPVYPVRLNRRWNLVNRAILPVQSNPGPPGQPRKVGVGDFIYEGFFTPSERTREGWIWGVGPILSFDTARDDVLGQGKYGAGPAAVVVREPGAWTYGALVTQSWSFGGNAERASVSTFQLQPIASLRLSPRHSVGYTGTITADWHRHGGQRWTVPLGLTWSVLSRPPDFMPVNTIVGAGYNVVRPERAGTWFLRFQVNFILPR